MRHRAFTLVELLVVISIITLLAALSFFALGGARQRAKAVVCRANLHQLLISLHNYDAEHQSLPYGYDFKGGAQAPGGQMGNPLYELPGWWWYHYARVVRVKSREGLKLLQCPSSRLEDSKLNVDVLYGKYGVNRSLCKVSPVSLTHARGLYTDEFVGSPLSIGSICQPGSTLLIGDSGYSLLCWWNATVDPQVTLSDKNIEDTSYVPGLEINKKKLLWPGQTVDAIGGRHPNKTVNVGFADGHADIQPASGLLVEKTKDGQYTNTRLWQGR
jgi:prepilin-type N-terminal cleavage/methylation domain-containing protein/prepilin-type processing-associated H-X9-DG protein